MKCKPSFFVVGAQKAGTTALHNHLSKHPGLFLPAVKETHFFDDGHGEYHLGVQHYLDKYFDGVEPARVAGEVDPEYLFFPEVAPRLARHFPDAKLIFIFREPVSRAFSHYQMSFSRGIERLGFAEALEREAFRMSMQPENIDPVAERVPYVPPSTTEADRRRLFNHVVRSDLSYVMRSQYAEQVERYLACFPRERMLFLLSEDLRSDPTQTMRRVYEFLGVSYVEPVELAVEERNQATAPRSVALQDFLLDSSASKAILKRLLPQSIRSSIKNQLLRNNRQESKGTTVLDPALAQRMRENFHPHNERLAQLIGKDLSAWRL